MIVECGRIQHVDGRRAWVVCETAVNCQRCAEGRGCGGGLLGRLLGDRLRLVAAQNRVSAKAGERVEIGLDASAVLAGSLTMYLVPLTGLLIGAVAGGAIAGDYGSDPAAAVGALAGFAGGLWLVRRIQERFRRSSAFEPIVLRVLPDGSETPIS